MEDDPANDMRDLFFDDLDGIFDDEDGGGPSTDDRALNFDDTSALAALNPLSEGTNSTIDPTTETTSCLGASALTSGTGGTTDSSASNGVPGEAPSLRRSTSEPAASSNRRRRSDRREIEGCVPSVPPPTWQNEAADRPHRQAMIIEVARLLQLRKKTHPTQEWLQQLPHKARKLEERLYRNATSLEAYLDKRTLKTRLKKLARVITKQFLDAKRRKRGSASSTSTAGLFERSSFLSRSSSLSSASSLRDSITSIDSLRSLRESLARGSSLSSPGTGASVVPVPSMVVGGSNVTGNSSGNAAAGQTGKQRLSLDAMSALKSIPETPFSSNRNEQITQQTSGQEQNRRTSVGSSASTGASGSRQNSFSSAGSGNISDIERQKLVNAQLQQQIMDNIRQQEELVRKLQASSSTGGSGTGNLPGNTASSGSMIGSVTSGAPGPVAANSSVPGRSPVLHSTTAALQAMQRANQLGPNVSSSLSGVGGAGHTSSTAPNQIQANLLASMNTAGATAPGAGDQFTAMAGMNAARMGMQFPSSQAALSNSMMAMNNRNMLQQSFLRASQGQGMTSVQQQQQQQQLSLLRGSGILANPSMVPATAVMQAQQQNHPVVPVAGVTAGAAAGGGGMMPPPQNVGMQRLSATQVSLQEAAKKASKGLLDDPEPLSPGSFNW